MYGPLEDDGVPSYAHEEALKGEPMTTAEILPRIFQLSSQDQIMIVEAIRNHLVGGIAPVDEKEFRRDLKQRLADAEAHPEDLSSLDDVMARLRKGRGCTR
jgi:putative addiction module component (TIGR02574 family)